MKKKLNSNPTLYELASKHGTDKLGNGFIPHYLKYFEEKRFSVKKILEIGVLNGNSLKTWRDYFPNAVIYGLDCLDKRTLNSDRIKIIIADQKERESLAKAVINVGGDFDIIIDDGSHKMKDQQVSLGFLFRYLKPKGIYVIEDLHTSKIGEEYNSTKTKKTTLFLLQVLRDMKRIESDFITLEEKKYIEKEFESCSVEPGRLVPENLKNKLNYDVAEIGFIKKS